MKIWLRKCCKAGFALLLTLLAVTGFAQTSVTGTVIDDKSGNPIVGATVSVRGTNVAVATDASGNFTIKVPTNGTLVISSVNYETKTVNVAGATNLQIKLAQGKGQLDDVVVVAYGSKKKSDLTGSVVSVGTKDFQKGVINSSEQLLVGKVPGLEVTTGGGAAGGGSKIRIRGNASLNASNDPLIVIDGIAVDGNNLAGSPNLLSTINPNDIESMSVLKDASAAALYGSRASNGVIIITTKKGTSGKTRYNFNTKYSVGTVTNYVDVLSGDDVRRIINADAVATNNNAFKNQLGSANTNWQKAIYQNAIGIDNNLSASGTYKTKNGKVRIPFRASAGYLSQTGVLKTNKFDRLTASINLSPKFFNDNLSVLIATKYAFTNSRFANEGAIGSALGFDPTQPINSDKKKFYGLTEYIDADGNPRTLSPRNPVGLLENRRNFGDASRIIASAQADYRFPFFKDLHAVLNVAIDDARGFGYSTADSLTAESYADKGQFKNYKQKKLNTLIDASLTYSKDITAIKSKIDVLALHSYQDFRTRDYGFVNYTGVRLTDPDYKFDIPQYRLESYVGRINYSYNNIVLLTGSIRRDESSRFAPGNRVGIFPAAAAAIRLSQIFAKNSTKLTELKLRASWGETGQQDVGGYYDYLPRYSVGTPSAQYEFGGTFYDVARPRRYDPSIKWETTEAINLGLDFGLFSNRITGNVDVYQKKTKDLLSVVPVPPGANFDTELLKNVGNMDGEGIEIALNVVPVKNNNITWEIGVNGSYNSFEITNLLQYPDPNFKGLTKNGIAGGTSNQVSRFAIGYAPYVFYLFKQVYDAQGNPIQGLFEDVNRDGAVNEEGDLVYTKKPNADFSFGFNTSLSYKKWSFSAAAHGSVGNYLYNNFNSASGFLGAVRNDANFITNAGVGINKTNFTKAQYLSDYYLENASFLRMDNINLGYNFGRLGKTNANLRLSASVQNVFVITKYSGVDPESANNGVDNTIYPRPRVISFGANIDF
jgi:TonB-dependent starch-binding outer membrane protein SusC